MDEVIGVFLETGALAVLGLAGAVFMRRQFRFKWFLVALALNLFYQVLLTRGFWMVPSPVHGLSWNWVGKLAAIAGTIVVMSLPAFGWRRCGATLHQGRQWRGALVVLAMLGGLFFYLALSAADGRDDLETIFFQWTMPGLDEELFYRGTLLLALNEAFRSRTRVLGAPIGFGGVLSTILFGLTHALSYEHGLIEFDTFSFAITGVPAILLLWLRERTGSLVMPVIGHNMANGAATLF
jgi:hypothetical protein